MGRTPVPPRVNLEELESLIRQRRSADYSTTSLRNETIEALVIEARLFRVHYEASKRRRKDAVRVRKPRPSKITLENVNEDEEAPGG
jgi:hypothetical protein